MGRKPRGQVLQPRTSNVTTGICAVDMGDVPEISCSDGGRADHKVILVRSFLMSKRWAVAHLFGLYICISPPVRYVGTN